MDNEPSALVVGKPASTEAVKTGLSEVNEQSEASADLVVAWRRRYFRLPESCRIHPPVQTVFPYRG
jgi:hypothetical protein